MIQAPKKLIAETLTLMATAFGFVAALAWNEAIKALISQLVPQGQGVWSLFVYALVATAIAVLVTSRILKIRDRFDPDKPPQSQ